MMFSRRAGAKPSDNVRQALYASFLLSYLILMVNFHTGPSSDPLFLSLGIPISASHAAVVILGIGFLGFSDLCIAERISERGRLEAAFAVADSVLNPVPVVPFANGAVAIKRPSDSPKPLQHRRDGGDALRAIYLGHQLFREAGSERRTAIQLAAFCLFRHLIAGGIALFIPGPWLASRVFHFDFAASFLIFTALVNIHHFILDGAIWKLRDGRIAQLLLNSQERIADKLRMRQITRLQDCAGCLEVPDAPMPFASRSTRASRMGRNRSGSLLLIGSIRKTLATCNWRLR